MKFDPSAVFSTIARESTPEEQAIGNLGALYVHLRGLGSTIFYVRKVRDLVRIFTRYQTVVNDETKHKTLFYRFVANSDLEELLLSQWEALIRNGNSLDYSYMNIWSMNEEDYGTPGTLFNEKLGITGTVFTPRKDILHSIIGYISVHTIYGDIFNIRVGLNTNQRGETSFFLYDPAFYDAERKTNTSKFKLDIELKNFVLRTIQHFHNIGVISFKDEEILDEPLRFLKALESMEIGATPI